MSISIKLLCCALLLTICFTPARSQIITAFAGNGMSGYLGDGSPATAAQIGQSSALAMDATGNLFICAEGEDNIRKVSPSGIITLVAGSPFGGVWTGDYGPATDAGLNNPRGVAVDAAGNVYIADGLNQRIRKVDPAGIITTIAGNGTTAYTGDGGPATAATLYGPRNLVLDATGNLYIAESGNNCIRKISTTGIISTFAGTGVAGSYGEGVPATSAQFNDPRGLTIDAAGNIYITDVGNDVIRKVNTAGIITTVAGNGTAGYFGDGGPATAAHLWYVTGVSVDAAGNIYIADQWNHVIRKVNTSGIISTFAGNNTSGYSGDGLPATDASLNDPTAVLAVASGDVYISDRLNNRVRKVCNPPAFSSVTGTYAVCAGGTTSLSASLAGGSWLSLSPLVATVSTSGIVSGLTAGTDTITYKLTNTCSSSITKTAVTVNPLPVSGIITGLDTICVGTTVTLSDAASGGIWSSIYPTVATIGSSGIASAITTGADTIHYTVTNSCGTSIAHFLLRVDSIPIAATISGGSAVCEGSTITLADPATGGTWTSISPAIATISATGIVSGAAPGTDSIRYTVTNLCGSSHTVVPITVNPLPHAGTITGQDSVCITNSITVADTAPGGTWTAGNTNISVDGTGLVTGLAIGSATISYAVSNSCGTDAALKTVVVYDCTTSVHPLQNNAGLIALYPNPMNDQLFIHAPSSIGKVVIKNMVGQVVVSIDTQNSEQLINTEKLLPGIYFVQVNDGYTGKVIKY